MIFKSAYMMYKMWKGLFLPIEWQGESKRQRVEKNRDKGRRGYTDEECEIKCDATKRRTEDVLHT